MSAKLILTRKGSIVNRRQRFKVIIDGAEAGQIKNDDTEEFTLQAGTHTLQCKISWMSSAIETVELTDGANTYLSVSNGMKFIVPLYFILLAGVFIPFLFNHFAHTPVPRYASILQVILIFPAVIYYILYVSVYRKKYLVIGEDKSNPFR